MKKAELIELMRISYIAGIDDKESNMDRWCQEGSHERAEELFQEFSDDEIIRPEMLTDK